MDYVRLGGTGLEVSRLCLGAWMFGSQSGVGEVVDRTQAHELLDAAFERGINFLDTANSYGDGNSERYIGEWLRDREREDLVIASKVFFTTRGRQRTGLSRKIIRTEIEGSLERLGTDYLDIYYVHGWHEGSPLEETLSALNDLVHDGKVHYVGVSNFASWQLVWARWLADVRGFEPVNVIQPRYNAVDRVPYTVDPAEMPLPDLFDACRRFDVAVCPYSPLAEGFLTGKYERAPDGQTIAPEGSRATLTDRYGHFPPHWWDVLDAVRAVANELGATLAQVALRWAMDVEGLTSVPIVGGRTVEQLDSNLGALEVTLTREQHARIAAAVPEWKPHGAYSYTP